MKVSPEPKKVLRSAIGKIATVVAFALVIGSLGVSAARADGDRDDRGRHGNQYRDNDNRGYRGPSYAYAPQPDYYYAPQPNYYAAPEPDYYYQSGPTYYDAPRPQGFNLFFGF